MKTATISILSDEELRMARARIGKPIYVIAAEVGLHPSYLGKVFSGKMLVSDDLALKLKKALQMAD